MKLIDLFKLQKKRKSQDRVSKTDPMKQTPLDGDGYMSSVDSDENKARNDGVSDIQ